MLRSIPAGLEEAPTAPPPPPKIHTLRIAITTAVLGGGVEAGKSDPLMPVRASEIRGSLRFWWRASRGARFTSAADLKAREDRIWGTTDLASPVVIEVANARLGAGVPAMRPGQPPHYEEPRYALFPAQSNPVKNIHKGGAFEIRFRMPSDCVDDFDAAMRYWVLFGGIGSRTRRGLGSLYCPEYSNLTTWYAPNDLEGPAGSRPWPTLHGGRIAMGDPKTPMTHQQAWETAIGLLRDFRQAKVGSNRFGRSAWPEPDAIRRLRDQTAPAHATPVTHNDEFPRAAFGLPIIFHFRQDQHRRGDPDDQSLEPIHDGQRADRMASPVILKPLAVSPTHSVPVCLVLNTPGAAGLELRAKGKPDLPVSHGRRDAVGDFLRKVAGQRGWTWYQI